MELYFLQTRISTVFSVTNKNGSTLVAACSDFFILFDTMGPEVVLISMPSKAVELHLSFYSFTKQAK